MTDEQSAPDADDEQSAPDADDAKSAPDADDELILTGPFRLVATPGLVAANVLAFLVMVASGVSIALPTISEMLAFGANFGGATTNGQWWRLIASTFIHHGLVHLIVNMLCLWVLGSLAERLFGRARLVALYVLSGVAGSVASLLWHPWAISAGASGAVFGIAGALAAKVYLGGVRLPEHLSRLLVTSLIIFIGFTFAFGATAQQVDNAGHLGGLAIGVLLGAVDRYGRVFYAGALASALGLAALCPLAVRISNDEPRVQFTKAVVLILAGDHAGAIRELEDTVARAPDLTDAQNTLTALYLEESRYDEAVAAARRAVELDPQSEGVQGALVQALFLAGDYEAVLEESKIALQLEPRNLQVRSTLSRALYALDRRDDAFATLEEAIEWAPESSFPYLERGWLQFQSDELDAAVSSMEKAIEMAPEDPEGYNRLSLVLARAGAYEQALTAIEKALELNPGGPHLHDSLGTVRFYRGELDQAVAAYQRAIDLDERRGVYHYNLSLALEKRGSTVAAGSARTRAFELDPGLEPSADGSPMM